MGTMPQRLAIANAAVSGTSEGCRFRFGIAVPIHLQYVKIMAVRGAALPQVFGTVWIVYWATLKSLLLLARPPRHNHSTHDALDRVEELLFLRPSLFLQRAEYEMLDGSMLYAPLCAFTYTVLAISLAVFEYRRAPIWIAFVGFSQLRIQLDVLISLNIGEHSAQPTWNTGRWWRVQASRISSWVQHPRWSPANVGGDVGFIFLVFWVVYCAKDFDGSGTERPNWPWLDWLG